MSDPTLSYATPAPRPPRAVAPSVVLMLTALGLVFLGGCFTIGIMILNMEYKATGPSATAPVRTAGSVILEVVLYLVAFACFAGAAGLIFLGIKWLRRTLP